MYTKSRPSKNNNTAHKIVPRKINMKLCDNQLIHTLHCYIFPLIKVFIIPSTRVTKHT